MYRAPKWLIVASAILAVVVLFVAGRLIAGGDDDLSIDEVTPESVFAGNSVTIAGSGCPTEGEVTAANGEELVLITGPSASASRMVAVIEDGTAEVVTGGDDPVSVEVRAGTSPDEDGNWSASLTVPRNQSGTWTVVAACLTLIEPNASGTGARNSTGDWTATADISVS